MSLTEFLAARLDEDESAARASHTWQYASGRHIVRHDPARALRDVEARRAIVAVHTTTDEDGLTYCDICPDGGLDCATLRHLAAVYADHRDYDEAWQS